MATKARCADCGQKGKSREHIIPTWLIKKTPEYSARFSKLAGKVGQNEHVITDVCTSCNSGPLGLLDDYGAKRRPMTGSAPIGVFAHPTTSAAGFDAARPEQPAKSRIKNVDGRDGARHGGVVSHRPRPVVSSRRSEIVF